MKEQNLIAEINTYFEKLGLNDAVNELSEKFTDAYMIPGEETTDLRGNIAAGLGFSPGYDL